MMEESPWAGVNRNLIPPMEEGETGYPDVMKKGRDLTEGRATFNLLAGEYTTDQVREAVKYAPVLGASPEAVAAMDNRELHAPWVAEGLPRKTQEFLAGLNPFLAAGYRNVLPEMSGLSDLGEPATAEPIRSIVGPMIEPYVKKAQAGRETLTREIDREKKKMALTLELAREYGSGWNELSDEDLRDSIELVRRETGIDFSDIPLEELRKKGAGDLDAGDLALDAINLFGWHDVVRAVTRKTPEELASVNANSSVEDRLELLSILRKQTEEVQGWTWGAKAVSGIVQSLPYMAEFWLTGGLPALERTAITKGAVKLSAREAIALTLREGGFAAGKEGIGFLKSVSMGAKALATKEGWKALGKAGGIALGMEAMKTPLYVPQATAKAYDEWSGRPLYLVGEGGIKTAVPDRYADEMAPLVMRELTRGLLARTSEYGGEFLPGFTKLLPKGARNGLTQAFLNYVSKDPAKSSLFAMRFARNAPIGDLVGEYLEEKGNDFLDYVSTTVAKATGSGILDMGRTSVWGPAEDELLTLAVVSAFSAVNGMAVRGVPDLKAYAQVSREVDNYRRNVDKLTELTKKLDSEGLTKDYVDFLRPDGRTLFVEPKEGKVFYQTAPEMAKALGITEESIADAEKNHTLIAVDENALLMESAKSPEAKKNGELLFQSTRASTGKTVGSVLEGEAGDEIRARYQERKALADEFLGQLTANLEAAGALPGGVTARAKQAALRLAAVMVANIYQATTVDEGKELVRNALENLSFIIAGNEKSGADPRIQAVEDALESVEKATEPDAGESTEAEAVGKVKGKAPAKLTKAAAKLNDAILSVVGKDGNAIAEAMQPFAKEMAAAFLKKYPIRGLDAASVENIALEKMWRAVEGVDQEKHPQPVAFVYKTAMNAMTTEVRNMLRQMGRETSLNEERTEDGGSLEDTLPGKEATPEETLREKDAKAVLDKAVKKLSEGDRAILSMLQAGSNLREIGAKLGISAEAARQRINKLKLRLRGAVYSQAGENEGIKKTDELLAYFRDLSRGFRLDAGSVAAVRQSLGANIASLPENVKTSFLNFFDAVADGRIPDGLERAVSADGFVTALTSIGFKREGSTSAYLMMGENIVRVSHHSMTASTFAEHGTDGGNVVSIVLEKKAHQKRFRADENVDAVEYVFPLEVFSEKPGKLLLLLHDIGTFFATGNYTDHAESSYQHISGFPDFKEKARKKIEADKIMYQSLSGAAKGSIYFAPDFATSLDAMITLFGAADASTLPHELAHWTKALLGELVNRGFASERMKADWEALNKWLDAQKYENEAGTDAYNVEREEKFARALEAYLQTGRAPSLETQSAFYTLRQMIAAVYQYAKRYLMDRYGFELTDDIKTVFDHLLDTDRVMREQSPLLEAFEALKSTFGELLGLSKDEAKAFKRLAENAHAETVNALEKRKRQLLPGLRAKWIVEAQDLMEGMKVYKLWNEIAKGGGLEASLLEEGLSGLDRKARNAMLRVLRRTKMLTKANEGMDAAALAAKYGYAGIQAMAEELADTLPPKEFVKNYLNQAEAAFNETLEINGTELTEGKMRDLLDALMEKMAERAEAGGGAEGWRREKAEQTASVEAELSKMTVKQIMSDTGLLRSIRSDSRKLVEAMGKKDWTTALTLASGIRKNLVLLGEAGKAAKRVERTKRILKRANEAKEKVIFGDYWHALKELYYVFGISGRKDAAPPSLPDPEGAENWRERARDLNANDDVERILSGTDDTEKPETGKTMWAGFLFGNDRTDYRNLSFADFEILADFTDFLNGTGRELESQAKESFQAWWTGMLDKCLASLGNWERKYHNRKVEKSKAGILARRFLLLGRNLRLYLAKADKFSHLKGEQGGNLDLWDQWSRDASNEVVLFTETYDRIRPHTETLARLWKEKKILLPTGVPFTGNGLQNAYSVWTEDMVIAFCLNMGNVTNRSRVQNGYEWTDEQMEQVMACMPEEGWRAIQGIWDALGGSLQRKAAETFLRERHYHLKLVRAQEFVTKTADGKEIELRGGYYPIYYAARTHGGDVRVDQKGTPLHANISATNMRAENLVNVDPVSLDPGCLDRHIREVSHYAATRMGCRATLKVLMDSRYKEAFGATQSYEAYEDMLALAKNLANPAEEIKSFTDAVARWARTGLTAGALMLNFRSVGMQVNSLTVGADELGEYYAEALHDALLHPSDCIEEVKRLSAFMRHRAEYFNIDAAESLKAFDKGVLDKVQRKTAVIGYFGMKMLDRNVASIGWMAKYRQTRDELQAKGGLTLEEVQEKAVAAADGFVARTQGANRPLELTTAQLSEIGRALTPFLTAANAQYNTLLERVILPLTSGVLSFPDAVGPILMNLVFPMVLAGLVAALFPRGGDDDKKRPWLERSAWAFTREALSSPLSGVPVVRDLWEAMLGATFAKAKGQSVRFTGDILSARELEEISKVFRTYAQGAEAVFDGNAARAFYKAAEATGWMLHVPAVQMYAKTKRLLVSWDMEPEWMQEIDEAVSKRKGENK